MIFKCLMVHGMVCELDLPRLGLARNPRHYASLVSTSPERQLPRNMFISHISSKRVSLQRYPHKLVARFYEIILPPGWLARPSRQAEYNLFTFTVNIKIYRWNWCLMLPLGPRGLPLPPHIQMTLPIYVFYTHKCELT